MSWLDERTPLMPSVLRGYLDQESGEDGSGEGLTRAAVAEMINALALPGRDRVAAFHLLASDAYGTYACEAAAASEAVEADLLRILAAVQVTES